MRKRAARAQESDLFIPRMNSLPLKDQREMTERPFFSPRGRCIRHAPDATREILREQGSGA